MLPYVPRRDFTDVLQVTDPETEIILDYLGESLEGRRVRERLGQRKCRKDEAQEGFSAVADTETERGHFKNKRAVHVTASKEGGTSVLLQHGTAICRQPARAWKKVLQH